MKPGVLVRVTDGIRLNCSQVEQPKKFARVVSNAAQNDIVIISHRER